MSREKADARRPRWRYRRIQQDRKRQPILGTVSCALLFHHMRGEQIQDPQLLRCRAVQRLDDRPLDGFHVLTPSCRDRLNLRRAEESRLICCAVSLCAPDQRAAEKRLAAVDDLIAQLAPPAPCVCLFRHPCGGFGALDGRGVDRLGLGRQPRTMQTLRKGKPAFSVQLPRPEHDFSQIEFHVKPSRLLFCRELAAGGVKLISRTVSRFAYPVPLLRRVLVSLSVLRPLSPCPLTLAIIARCATSCKMEYCTTFRY